MLEPIALKYKELPFLSKDQLVAHHDTLYVGYVKKTNELREKMFATKLEGANATYSEVREVKMELGFALNGARLHERYFENMGGDGVPTAKIHELLELGFGSFENWQQEFVALGMASRGWVVLGINYDGVLEHYICDAHNQGGIWGANPILVLDVYEHAYFTDYGTNRKEYLEKFIENINWKVVEERFLRTQIIAK
jgi:Fe-Mn family superoxide dismutase